jgi:hypothetical protein
MDLVRKCMASDNISNIVVYYSLYLDKSVAWTLCFYMNSCLSDIKNLRRKMQIILEISKQR